MTTSRRKPEIEIKEKGSPGGHLPCSRQKAARLIWAHRIIAAGDDLTKPEAYYRYGQKFIEAGNYDFAIIPAAPNGGQNP